MTLNQIGLCLIFALSLGVGQILFKLSANAWNASAQGGLMGLISPYLIGALLLYAVTIILWVYILRTAPLSRAYVFSLLGSAIVPVAAHLLFREPLSERYILGIALTLTGAYLCVSA